ncbi:unnamed protein product [Albugo candida]|uniref:dihydroorotase n=1 Tax=Albugo candida TaxID=65357 RepID=A0A024GGA3_9STRA|nr:unnamed protein product [Albugo candida]|eukprot:CCI45793.1 unnamed protein product [Albugo candida]
MSSSKDSNMSAFWLKRRPDDFHHHLRDDECLELTVDHVSRVFGRCIAMPNLNPPIVTTEMALEYHDRIQHILDKLQRPHFQPLMTLYMTDRTTSEEIYKAASTKKIFAVKLYPAGATTNSDAGVTNVRNIYPALEAMVQVSMPLLVHGEVTESSVDIFDKEAVFLTNVLTPLIADFPSLKVVLEHITTKEAADFVMNASENVAATITPQHLLYNRNAIFQGGLHPHMYCLPVMKREIHRKALLEVLASGSKKFFLGTDSAPHVSSKKESSSGCAGIYSAHAALELYAEAFDSIGRLDLLESFACENASLFYGLPLNPPERIVFLNKEEWVVPESYSLRNGEKIVPLRAGSIIKWKCEVVATSVDAAD